MIYGCVGKETTKETVNIPDSVKSDKIAEHEHREGQNIEYNNGAKWKVVPDMMQYIRTMEKDVNKFIETEKNELKGYVQLSTTLQKNIDNLTANCTMQGKAHDELHKWLVPYIDMVDRLGHATTKDEAGEIIEEIKESFKIMNEYFE